MQTYCVSGHCTGGLTGFTSGAEVIAASVFWVLLLRGLGCLLRTDHQRLELCLTGAAGRQPWQGAEKQP